jgi:protein-tyrosine phosphatase
MVLLETAALGSTDTYYLEPLLADPNHAIQELGEGRAHVRCLRAYRSFCESDQARDALGLVMSLLAEGNRMGIHCAVGKDRTGWAIASILWYLGVDWDDVLVDYLKSNDSLEFATSRVLERVSQLGGDPGVIEPMLVVREEYLMEFRRAVISRFGSITSYVEDGLGLGSAGGSALRVAMIKS